MKKKASVFNNLKYKNEETAVDNTPDNEETAVDNTPNNEETVVDDSLDKENTVVDSKNESEESYSVQAEGWTKMDKSNNKKRVGAIAAGLASGTAAAAAGVYFMNNDEEEPAEAIVAKPVEGHTANPSNTSSESQPIPEPEFESEPVITPEQAPYAKSYTEAEPQPAHSPTVEPTAVPEATADSQSDSMVEVEPEVEILGVEVVHTENGDMTLGGMTINGEEYVLVDVDGGDFDIAWHDENHDLEVQETELTDIRDTHISVNDFTQALHNDAESTTSHENEIEENYLDSVATDEIDYMESSDTSGLE